MPASWFHDLVVVLLRAALSCRPQMQERDTHGLNSALAVGSQGTDCRLSLAPRGKRAATMYQTEQSDVGTCPVCTR